MSYLQADVRCVVYYLGIHDTKSVPHLLQSQLVPALAVDLHVPHTMGMIGARQSVSIMIFRFGHQWNSYRHMPPRSHTIYILQSSNVI